jgi:2-oxo-3-hexenedioate decarboxylase
LNHARGDLIMNFFDEREIRDPAARCLSVVRNAGRDGGSAGGRRWRDGWRESVTVNDARGAGVATPDAAELAARLHTAVAERTAIEPLSADVPGLDLAAGYAVQRVLRERAGPLAGWKLGVTSRAKQVQVGVANPVHGFLAAANALDVGEPLDTAALIQPRCEPEIVFCLGRDLAGPHVTAADVLAATAGVAVGIEVLDSRYRDYRFTMADVVADNTSAGRFVVGTPVPPADIDLRLVGVVFEHNGEVVDTAAGAAVLGHPAAAVAWLVRALAADSGGLAAGQIVLSGGLTAAVPVGPGDVVVATIDRLGTLELDCKS